MSLNGDNLNPIPKAAQRLGIKDSTLRKWRVLRKLEFVEVGGRVFVRDSEIDRVIREGIVPALEAR